MIRLYSTLRKIDGPYEIQKYYRLSFIKSIEYLRKDLFSGNKTTNGCACEPSKEKSDKNKNLRPRILDEFLDLNCKTTVVVGGDDGIGYAAAHDILSHKAKVVGIFGRNVCKGMEACHALNCRFGKRKAVFFKVDVTSKNDIDCAICKLDDEFGQIEAFVNSFAICDGKNWETELNTNLIGMTRSTIAAHKYLSETKKGGVIVNTAGIFGLMPSAGCPTTSAAQHGIIGLSTSFGKEILFKHTNVRVIALCPGLTATKLFKDANKRALTTFMGKCFQDEMGSMKKQRPEVCGNAIVWLIRYGVSGSLWMIRDSELYKINCNVLDSCTELYNQFPA